MDTTPPIRSALVLGAGKIGATVADMLAVHHPDLRVTLAGLDLPGTSGAGVAHLRLDVGDAAALDGALATHDAVIEALPFHLVARVAEAAARRGVHCLGLTEDLTAAAAIRGLAASARSLMVPQCGLAPGVVGMLGNHLAAGFDELLDLHLRVGALTRHDSGGGLHYAFTWSVDGLVNEYCMPCPAIVQGQAVMLQPLEGLEALSIDGRAFEAFNTSGGLGGLCETLEGRVRSLDYKTIRHPGHRDAMHLLLHGLRLIERRDLLREVLLHAVPHSRDDMVIVHVWARGLRGGRLEEETRSARLLGGTLAGAPRTAIELTTAAGVVGVFELLRQGSLPRQGFLRSDEVAFEAFLGTRVGHHYAALADRLEGAGTASAGSS